MKEGKKCFSVLWQGYERRQQDSYWHLLYLAILLAELGPRDGDVVQWKGEG